MGGAGVVTCRDLYAALCAHGRGQDIPRVDADDERYHGPALAGGLPVTQCRTIGPFREDDADEMHWRQDAICRSHGIELRDLGDRQWSCPVGVDNTLTWFEQDGSPVTKD